MATRAPDIDTREWFQQQLVSCLTKIAVARYGANAKATTKLVVTAPESGKARYLSSYVGRMLSGEFHLSRSIYTLIRDQHLLAKDDSGRGLLNSDEIVNLDWLFDEYEQVNKRADRRSGVKNLGPSRAQEIVREELGKAGLNARELGDQLSFVQFVRPLIMQRRAAGDIRGAIRFAKAMLEFLKIESADLQIRDRKLIGFRGLVAKDGSYAAHQGNDLNALNYFISEFVRLRPKGRDGYAHRSALMAQIYHAKQLGVEFVGNGLKAWNTLRAGVPSYFEPNVLRQAHVRYVTLNEAVVELWSRGANLSDRPRELGGQTLEGGMRSAIAEARDFPDPEAMAFCAISLARAQLKEDEIKRARGTILDAMAVVQGSSGGRKVVQARCLYLLGQIENKEIPNSGAYFLRQAEELSKLIGDAHQQKKINAAMTTHTRKTR